MPSTGEKRLRHSRESKQRLLEKGVSAKSGPGSRPRWTSDEDSQILEDDFDVVLLSKKLDRTVEAIYLRRSKLLRRN